MISVSTLYDEYVDRQKLSKQKSPFEYIVPPPSIGVGTKIVAVVSVANYSISNYSCSNYINFLLRREHLKT